MTNVSDDFRIDYIFNPNSDSIDQLDHAWDIIYALFLEDIKNEIQEIDLSESMPC